MSQRGPLGPAESPTGLKALAGLIDRFFDSINALFSPKLEPFVFLKKLSSSALKAHAGPLRDLYVPASQDTDQNPRAAISFKPNEDSKGWDNKLN